MSGLFEKPVLGPVRIAPWPFQEEAVERVRDEFKKGVRRTLLVVTTGGGKTLVAAMIARRSIEKGKRVLFLAHTDELIDQAANRFDLLGVDVGIEKANQHARSMFDPDVVVGSLMTLKDEQRLAGWPSDYFDMLIIDEAHRSLSPAYKRIIAHFPKARLLGLTATPKRTDKQDLGTLYESVAFKFDLFDAWDNTPPGPYCCDLRFRNADIKIDLRGLTPKGGDLTNDDLSLRISPHIEACTNKIKEHAGDSQTLIFCPSVASAQATASALRDCLGVRAEAVWGEDPDRRWKVEGYRSGDIQMLANMGVLTEGADFPATATLGLLRPTQSWSLYLQMLGRALRRGKEYARIIDFAYLTDKFELVQPHTLLEGVTFDQELALLASDIFRKDKREEPSLRDAVEQAREQKRRTQVAITVQIKERQVQCQEIEYSARQALMDGQAVGRGSVGFAVEPPKATPKQVTMLQRMGFEGTDRWSRVRASTTIGIEMRRLKAGLATEKQRRCLIRSGIAPEEARRMTKQEASAFLDTVFKKRTG